MTTTLTVLGGSAASVGTGQGCAGYLVEHADTRIVLDLGPGTLQELRKHTDFRALDAVVVSHLHVDHMLDVVSLRFSLSYNPVKPERRVGLWMPPGGVELLNRLGSAFDFEGDPETFFTNVFEVAEFDPDQTLTIGDVNLTFAPTVHWVPCWAIRVHPRKGGGDLFYSADTGPTADLSGLANGATVVMTESTTPIDQKADGFRGHIAIDEGAALARNSGASTWVVTHMFEENDPAATVDLARTMFDGDVVHARPGTVVTWT
ncbi:MAG TPA: MBL fold metallo-hydrolase [Thermomicrobiales bacterium]|nr:MBL fold metallo-hydrolase [Thermomicrobiales bacterium]